MLENDKVANLYYFGARYYNGDLGMWHSLDPMANQRPGWSPYNYASCNPINRIDPTGMLDNGNQDESFWSRISSFLGFSGNNSHPENLGTQITESTVSGANEALNKKVKQAGKQLVETTAKVADATSDGSMDAVTDQAIKVGVNFGAGRLVNSAASKVVTRTGLSSTLFRSSSTGQFVSNS